MSWLAEMKAREHVLALREILVRLDENIKADTLLQECVPYLLDADPFVDQARRDQRSMVAHLQSPEAYAAYYAANVHERPFEEQYGISALDAHLHLPRVQILRDWLEERPGGTVLDLACNDGWMAANLCAAGNLGEYCGVDLNPGCIERAIARHVPGAAFSVGDAMDADALHITEGGRVVEGLPGIRSKRDLGFDVVVAFEVVEHVADPDELLSAMVRCCEPGGSLLVSTPYGATERGDLPSWWHVEPKGHVRVFTPQSFHDLLSRHGTVESIVLGPDNVMVAQVRTDGSREMLARIDENLKAAAAAMGARVRTHGP